MIFVTISYISTNMTGHVTTFQHFNFLVKLVFILTDQFEQLINTKIFLNSQSIQGPSDTVWSSSDKSGYSFIQ